MSTRVVAPGLFDVREGVPHLIGSTCSSCGTTTFPQQHGCPRCTGTEMELRELPRTGTLWSWTVQAFRPKSPYAGPESFEPYGVGYVDLGDVLVESRLTENDAERLEIGMPVELVLEAFRTDDDGAEVLTFAFAPITSPSEDRR